MQSERRSRRRLPRSCVECRRRKIRCDRNDPCSHCVLTKCSCLYIARRASTTSTTNFSQPENVAGRLTQAQRGTQPDPQGHSPYQDSSSTLVSPTADEASLQQSAPSTVQASNGERSKDDDIRELTSRIQSLERLLSQRDAGSAEGPAPTPLPSHAQGDGSKPSDAPLVLNKSRLFGQTHWSSSVVEFKRIAAFMHSKGPTPSETATTAQLNLSVRNLLQQCKALGKSTKYSRPGRVLSCPEPLVLSKDAGDRFAHLYVANFESAFRILHVPTFWKEYGEYWENSTHAPDVTVLKVNLVMAIGSGLCQEPTGRKATTQTALQWVYVTQDWISGPFEKSRLSFDCLQLHCLLLLARQVLSIGSDLSWVALGSLTRCSIQLGLNRDPRHFPQMSVLQAELRRRLWATILELNLQASLDSGTPPGFSIDDYDTEPPSNVNDEDINESTKALVDYSEATNTDTSLQRFLLRTLPPRLEMLHRMNGVERKLKDDEILALSSKLSILCRELGALAQGHDSEDNSGFKRNLTALLLRRFLLGLHRPLAGRIRENPLYYHSRKMAFDSAMTLLRPPPNELFSYVMRRGGGFFKGCFNHVSLALASELLIEMQEEGPDTFTGTTSYKKMLVEAVKEIRERWVERLKLGERNVMLHMKLSIVLTQAEENTEGISLQQRMAQSAKNSLKFCYSLMRANADSSHYNDAGSMSQDHLQLDLSDCSFDFGDIMQASGLDLGEPFQNDALFM
ncbi:hypothetical protein F5Y18DRAFT_413410 [Xylariaceae sp. FL1019]|nr:hypothetical protein F5Y18DRAFT_413410 [Xylariaceae sp. FL1019]